MAFQDHLYQAGLEGAAFFVIPDSGCLLIKGADRAAFLQRQTTNDIRPLEQNRAVLSVLTSPTARILDVLYLLDEGAGSPPEEAVTTLTLPGRGAATFRFLKSRIFFNDKVSLENNSQAWAQIDLCGPRAVKVLQQLGLPSEPALHAVHSLNLNEHTVRVFKTDTRFGLGIRLLLPAEAAPAVIQAMQTAGALELDTATYDLLRIEAGLPGPTYELIDVYTPLETRLESAVSGSKGCYTGQEILARQVTYDKVTQKLAGLYLNGAAQPGDKVWAEGKPAGQVTSAAHSPRFGWIALAVLKRAFLEPGTAVAVGASPEAAQPASAAALPFSPAG